MADRAVESVIPFWIHLNHIIALVDNAVFIRLEQNYVLIPH